MKADEKYHNQINDYLDGKLSGEEERAFEQAAQTDPVLAHALERERKTRIALSLMAKESLKNKMRGWYAEMEAEGTAPSFEEGAIGGKPEIASPEKSPWVSWKRKLLLAAALLAFCVFGWWLVREPDIINGKPKAELPKNPQLPIETPAPNPNISNPQTSENQTPALPNGQTETAPQPIAKKSPPEKNQTTGPKAANPFAKQIEAENQLFAKKLEQYGPTAGGSGGKLQALTDALHEYVKMLKSPKPDYAAMAAKLEPFAKDPDRRVNVNKCLSHAYQNLGQTSKAIEAFHEVQPRGNMKGDDASKYHLLMLCLSDLKNNREEAAALATVLNGAGVEEAIAEKMAEIRPLLMAEGLLK